ncbi:MAG: hypothetical protein M3Y59_08010, partial [Myxococcota bacterium]|nr:hypothetical protein [Myxococcota bacterium]
MSKSTSGRDLFRWAESRRRASSRQLAKAARWAPRRRNGFAAALAVVVEAGRTGNPLPSIRTPAQPLAARTTVPAQPGA